jgi:hypothetical protein
MPNAAIILAQIAVKSFLFFSLKNKKIGTDSWKWLLKI